MNTIIEKGQRVKTFINDDDLISGTVVEVPRTLAIVKWDNGNETRENVKYLIPTYLVDKSKVDENGDVIMVVEELNAKICDKFHHGAWVVGSEHLAYLYESPDKKSILQRPIRSAPRGYVFKCSVILVF